MKRLACTLLLIAASANAGMHIRTPPASWQWRADVFSSLQIATAYASQFTSDPPILVPTKNAKYIVFHRIYADFVDRGQDVEFTAHPTPESAWADFATRYFVNKGIVSAADGEWIVWNIN